MKKFLLYKSRVRYAAKFLLISAFLVNVHTFLYYLLADCKEKAQENEEEVFVLKIYLRL